MPYAYAGTTIADQAQRTKTVNVIDTFVCNDKTHTAFGKAVVTPNEEDLKFLKSLRVKWNSDEETKA